MISPDTACETRYMMAHGTVCVTAGLTGLLSFVFLTVAIATDYWYVIDVSDSRYNNGEGWEDLNSHSGLWRICEVMQKVFVILLPLSLVLLVLGGIGGLISSLANGLYLLLFTGSYFLIGGALTLAGICVYVAYSKAAFAIAKHIYGDKVFDNVHIGFSWSMVLACLSCILEVMSGALFLLAAKLSTVGQPEQSAVI
ncbi:transmembrane protein 235 isoform X2 [Mobula hypostoma]|uniref:transmembrane protein 235 isoform X2 n=1 Tax=Mobula hypostoma TaxID=723540 RepID=UPI002FC3253A